MAPLLAHSRAATQAGRGCVAVSFVARIFHESPAATADMAILPVVLGCRTLRRTVQVRLGSNPAVPRDGCPVAKPSLRSGDCNSRNIRARPRNLESASG